MFYRILAGAVFSLTIIFAAKEIPIYGKKNARAVLRAVSALIISAADLFMIAIGKNLSAAEYEQLRSALIENKEKADGFFPKYLQKFTDAIHNFVIGSCEFFSEKTERIFGFLGSEKYLLCFIITAAAVSSAVCAFTEKDSPVPEENGETTPVGKVIRTLIYDAVSDGFFAAPLGAAAVYIVCRISGAEYAAVICPVLWLLSYIPVIGSSAGVIFGVCVYICAVQPLKALIFFVASALTYICLTLCKNLITAYFEKKEQK